MTMPFAIDNQEHCLADVLNTLIAQTASKLCDIATAYLEVLGS